MLVSSCLSCDAFVWLWCQNNSGFIYRMSWEVCPPILEVCEGLVFFVIVF